MAKYHEWLTNEGLMKIEALAKNGLTDEQIAQNMGIGTRTLYEWKYKYPQISQAIKKGKEIVDCQVENALLKRALGYEYEEVKTYIEEVDGKKKKKVEKVIKHVSPDVTAMIFWLRNRKANEWSNREPLDNEKIKAEIELLKTRTEVLNIRKNI